MRARFLALAELSASLMYFCSGVERGRCMNPFLSVICVTYADAIDWYAIDWYCLTSALQVIIYLSFVDGGSHAGAASRS